MPDGFRLGVNRELVSWKLGRAKSSLHEKLALIEEGIRRRRYPFAIVSRDAGGDSSSDPLVRDFASLFRTRDLIISMEIQRLMILNEPKSAEEEMRSIQELVESKMQLFEKMSGGLSGLDTVEGAEALLSGKSHDALGRQLHRDLFRDQYQKHYAGIIAAAHRKTKEHEESFYEFFKLVDEVELLPAR